MKLPEQGKVYVYQPERGNRVTLVHLSEQDRAPDPTELMDYLGGGMLAVAETSKGRFDGEHVEIIMSGTAGWPEGVNGTASALLHRRIFGTVVILYKLSVLE